MAEELEDNIGNIPEEEAQPQVIINPLDEPVEAKPYTKLTVNVDPEELSKRIPAPDFQPTPIEGKKKFTIPPKENKEREPVNPELSHVSKKEANMAASQAASMIISGYEMLHVLGNRALQVSDRKLSKMQREGEIDLNVRIPYDYGEMITVGQFFQLHNKNASELLSVSEEFKNEIRPPLERVLSKHGIGMTDENFIFFALAKDVAPKLAAIYQNIQTKKDWIEAIKDFTAAYKASNSRTPTPPPSAAQAQQSTPPPPPPPPPPTSPVEQEGGDDYKGDDIRKYYQSADVVDSSVNSSSVKPDAIVLPTKKQRGRPPKGS